MSSTPFIVLPTNSPPPDAPFKSKPQRVAVTFHKIKTHSENQYNDMADDLADQARPIDRNLRKFPQAVTEAYTLDSFLNNNINSINWPLIKK
ncbi:hypothetical protein RhiirA5_429602 [Rhizophagus irregularis]|uniref:Uncharacterized protein n=1 Tax=Rhizophagus irregularis TaxID=588596 RepID=A0A2N0NY46_9GLOM|nr:hypothetical protein RhiirA5_429602 [Rhizophagus irregularis]